MEKDFSLNFLAFGHLAECAIAGMKWRFWTYMNIAYCRHKMNNFTKFSLYACNIELNAYGRIYWGAFLGHKTITVSFYALKQALNFLCHEYTLFLSLWPQRRNFCPREKTFPSESSLITWGTIFNTYLLGQNFTYSWHKNWSVCFRA